MDGHFQSTSCPTGPIGPIAPAVAPKPAAVVLAIAAAGTMPAVVVIGLLSLERIGSAVSMVARRRHGSQAVDR